MDVDDVILTTLVYLDDCEEIKNWCRRALTNDIPHNVSLSPEGKFWN